MGYHTDFYGSFSIDPPLEPEQTAYLNAFSRTRRVQRDETVAAGLPDPIRQAVGLPTGHQGEYFVGASGHMGQGGDPSVVNFNQPPSTQPGLWCQWISNGSGTLLEWDGGEKFYAYLQWLNYLKERFFEPWGRTLNGTVEWRGERSTDAGEIRIVHNQIQVRRLESAWGEWHDANIRREGA